MLDVVNRETDPFCGELRCHELLRASRCGPPVTQCLYQVNACDLKDRPARTHYRWASQSLVIRGDLEWSLSVNSNVRKLFGQHVQKL
jgi:hypothetical protein